MRRMVAVINDHLNFSKLLQFMICQSTKQMSPTNLCLLWFPTLNQPVIKRIIKIKNKFQENRPTLSFIYLELIFFLSDHLRFNFLFFGIVLIKYFLKFRFKLSNLNRNVFNLIRWNILKFF